jgi:hypothetical protein
LMSGKLDPINDRSGGSADGREGTADRSVEDSGGWRSQGLGLKVLLSVSIVVIVFAVVRCTLELSTGPHPVARIAVLRPSVDVPDGLLSAPPDSIACLAARQLARTLRSVSGVDAVVVESEVGDYDAVAAFSLSSSKGNVAIVLDITDSRSRVLAHAESEGPPDHLYAIVGIAARRAAGEIWPAAAAGSGDRR